MRTYITADGAIHEIDENDPSWQLPTPSQQAEQLKIYIVQAVQFRLDGFAQTRGYDGILSACTYATSPTAQFATEGQRAVVLRDQTWSKMYQILAEVEGGQRPMPKGFEDIEGELPALVW
jgi:hypothetical protein